MADLVGQNVWKDRIRQLEPTDPAAPSTWNPNYQDLINNDVYMKARFDAVKNEVETARGGKANLNERITSLLLSIQNGSSNFAGQNGVTITHNLGHTNFRVAITPTADPGGYLGEVWVIKSANTMTIYNSGSFRGPFDYQIYSSQ